MLLYAPQRPVSLPYEYIHVKCSSNKHAWFIVCCVPFLAQLGLDNVLVQMEGEGTCRAFLDALPDAGALLSVVLYFCSVGDK